jgi:hypothetical protein
MFIPNYGFDIDILPTEEFSYVLVNPGDFQGIETLLWNGIVIGVGRRKY